MNVSKKMKLDPTLGLVRPVKTKPMYLSAYGKKYYCGEMPSSLHTDFIHVFTMSMKKRGRVRISEARVQALNDMLKGIKYLENDNIVKKFQSVEEVTEFFHSVRMNNRNNFDAKSYYNKDKSEQYTIANQVPQERLSKRILSILGKTCNSPFILDIGCGSGLSSKFLSKNFAQSFTIGLDAAPDMLALCPSNNMDKIVWDLKQPLPLRETCFDICASVSAIHFLCGPIDEVERCDRHFKSLMKTNKNKDFAYQFFPENDMIPQKLLDAAFKAGFDGAHLLTDYTHHTSAFRWFIANKKTTTRCRIHSGLVETGKFFNPDTLVSCLLCHDHKDDDEHIQWMKRDHIKKARKLLRSYTPESLLSESEAIQKLTMELLQVFDAKITTEELSKNYEQLIKIIHT